MSRMEPILCPEAFLKPYNSKENEPRILELWEKSGFANPDTCVEKGVTAPDAKSYSIVLPPPNVTGTLHMGHAAMLAIQDILIRYHRMRGFKTLWLPGTDHAAIATQSVVEKDLLKSEKKTRHDLGREEFLKRVEEFAQASHDRIVGQVRAMGASVDWTREAYTLDEARNLAVRTAFKKMYDARLIYRGNRMVNWDPKMQTTVSDDEIEYVEQKDPFYYFKYGPFTIGTVRPETKFGDKYIVMHPDDARYKEYKNGQQLEVEWINGQITATIIKDEAADMSFGSGVMTITPAHSGIDFEIAQKHKLDVEQIINERGILLPIAGEFAGQHIKKARPMVVEKLRAKGLLVKVEDGYVHNVATNSRGGEMIEPQIKLQWFVDVNKKFTIPHSEIPGIDSGSETSLKELMRGAVDSGAIKIAPDRFERVYYNWIDNLRDWCISRQIWYGHRIPVWYKKEGKSEESEMLVGDPPTDIENWEQDPDTLDTWFSSGLWTFSTLGWPNFAETATAGKPGPENDFANYHPTDVLETGYDILFFWVARMILMTGFCLGTVPFRNVYLHGLVRDGQGRKMSKSLGNIIDPLTMIEKYGADAARLSLIVGASPGNDVKLSEDRVRGYKHFANKIWNITRFVLENSDAQGPTSDSLEVGPLNAEDEKLISEAREIARVVSEHIDNFRLDLAADTLYHFVWHRFADEIIEESKPILKLGGETAKSRRHTLYAILDTSLKLLHPFMPFVTEAIWKELPNKKEELVMIAKWPI
ncbi:MAG: valine--tRNA ligase [Candidatus Kaiserbacteria bacterium]|nr:valine--tRNA ligase [Candidatus Kaiserbacteria bacterium]